jgi:hypothetical protein
VPVNQLAQALHAAGDDRGAIDGRCLGHWMTLAPSTASTT